MRPLVWYVCYRLRWLLWTLWIMFLLILGAMIAYMVGVFVVELWNIPHAAPEMVMLAIGGICWLAYVFHEI